MKEAQSNNSVDGELPPKNIKEYTIPLTPQFFLSLLDNCSSLKYDFSESLYVRLCNEYAKLPLPASLRRTHKQSHEQQRLDSIRTRCIITCQRLRDSKADTESLLQYSKRTVYQERIVSAKLMTTLTKRRNPTSLAAMARQTYHDPSISHQVSEGERKTKKRQRSN